MTSVDVPTEAEGTGSAYAKLPNIASQYAIVGAAAVVTLTNWSCTAARVAIGGLTSPTTRTPSVEQALVGNKLVEESIAAAANAVQIDLTADIISDIHATADYRKAMAAVYLRRALDRAVARAGR